MPTIRAFFRLTGILVATVVVLVVLGIGYLFCFPKQHWRTALKNRVMQYWASVVSAIIGLHIKVEGPVPEPPFLLVSNHLGYIDILPFWKHLKTTFIAKYEIRSWPVIGWIAQLIGIVFIERGTKKDVSRVNTIIEQELGGNQGLILFPEGTSSKGKKVLPFKSSLLQFPASKQIPVYYASISYKVISSGSYRAWQDVCWWGGMDFATHFWKLLHIKASEATVIFGETPIQSNDRKDLTKVLHRKVEQQFVRTFKN